MWRIWMVGCRGRGENMGTNVGAMRDVEREKRKRRYQEQLEGREAGVKMGCHAEELCNEESMFRLPHYQHRAGLNMDSSPRCGSG